jgi:hypothetical protein
MSTPIKPPGGPSPADPSGSANGAGRVEGKAGELEKLVEGAASADAHQASEASSSTRASRLEGLKADLAAGRIGVDEAIDRMVEHALRSAHGLPEAQRSALEAQIRTALLEDPTLIALRKDLRRGSHT